MLKRYVLKMAKNPFGIYLLWMLSLLLFCIIGIPLLSIGHSGGEQVPFTLLGYTCDALAIGFIIISATSPFIYHKWYRKYAYFPLIVPLLIIGLLLWLMISIYISNGYTFAW